MADTPKELYFKSTAALARDENELAELSARQRVLSDRIRANQEIQKKNCHHPHWAEGTNTKYRRADSDGPYGRPHPANVSVKTHTAASFSGSEHCTLCYAVARTWTAGEVTAGPPFIDGTQAAELAAEEASILWSAARAAKIANRRAAKEDGRKRAKLE